MPGPEDIEVDTSAAGPRLIVSSLERRTAKAEGAIFAVPLPEGGPIQPFEIVGRDNVRFSPHGISLVYSEGWRLYVINHVSPCCHVIEIFEVKGSQLIFVDRLASTLLRSPNDLVALADGQIYVTNMGWTRGLLGLLGLLFAVPNGNVVHYKDGRWTVAADGIAYANGIAINRSGDTLYVAATREKAIAVFPRNRETGTLDPRVESIDIGSGVDNLSWADSNTLIAAAHPKLLALARHSRDKAHVAPSQIYSVSVRSPDGEPRVKLVYEDNGCAVSAASTGIQWNGALYMGQIFNRGITVCRSRS
jgi:arylesterase/paraoxonase